MISADATTGVNYDVTTGVNYVVCDICYGKGVVLTPDCRRWQLCPKCNGRGKIPVYTPTILDP